MVLTRVFLGGSLPEITATHWSDSRYPDGFTATSVFFAVNTTLSIIGGVLGLAGIALRRNPLLILVLLLVGGMTAWTSAALVITCAVPTAIAGDPTLADNGPWIIASVLMPLVALAPLWLSGIFQEYSRRSHAKRRQRIAKAQGTAPAAKQAAPASLASGEFDETAAAPWWLWLLGVFVFGMGLFTLAGIDDTAGGENWVALVISLVMILVVAPVVLGIARIRVTIKNGKLRVSSAIFGFPLRTIDASEIASVSSEEILPMEWGGWGWRFFPGGSAVVMKRSQGLAIELKDKRRFAVTIPNSAQAAAQLNSLIK
ncbi:hypothetical protein AUR04nite_09120 [Glutamicibacter uratoxydans]|uniref:DUF3093 domain-containing protein n=1 Tax=Glutamicibacter uratoxydans TaxID=43667 RepID=A0A4Y4DP51_GLUUR|nr:DUF3093 family protein [Glutamicibacter uratoxydans]GED05380.1 hypothetical protein AUR04nite_09120 [Glutamicibacter uratoxydans]